VCNIKGRNEGAPGLRTARRAKIPSKDLARGGTGAQNSKKSKDTIIIPSKDLARGGRLSYTLNVEHIVG